MLKLYDIAPQNINTRAGFQELYYVVYVGVLARYIRIPVV